MSLRQPLRHQDYATPPYHAIADAAIFLPPLRFLIRHYADA